MGSRFDNIQRSMFDKVTHLFGYTASWGNITGWALLKEPTDRDTINGVDFTPFHRIMEWRSGEFEGLFEAIREAATVIEVTIDEKKYYVAEAAAKYDGKTYRAVIYPK